MKWIWRFSGVVLVAMIFLGLVPVWFSVKTICSKSYTNFDLKIEQINVLLLSPFWHAAGWGTWRTTLKVREKNAWLFHSVLNLANNGAGLKNNGGWGSHKYICNNVIEETTGSYIFPVEREYRRDYPFSYSLVLHPKDHSEWLTVEVPLDSQDLPPHYQTDKDKVFFWRMSGTKVQVLEPNKISIDQYGYVAPSAGGAPFCSKYGECKDATAVIARTLIADGEGKNWRTASWRILDSAIVDDGL